MRWWWRQEDYSEEANKAKQEDYPEEDYPEEEANKDRYTAMIII